MLPALQQPLHLLIGGGDQIYNDPVWEVPALAEWVRLPNKELQLSHPFTQVRHPVQGTRYLLPGCS